MRFKNLRISMKNKRIWFGFLFLFSLAFAEQGGNDSFGYMWTNSQLSPSVEYDWIDAKSGSQIMGPAFNNSISGVQTLPFSFSYYGNEYTSFYVSSNGWLSFNSPVSSEPTNDTIPSTTGPSTMIAPFWDDLESTTGNDGGIYYKVVGEAPNRKAVVEWDIRNGANTSSAHFQAVLYEHSNLIKFQYDLTDGTYDGGSSATIGIKNDSNTGITYAYNEAGAVSASLAILFHNKSIQGNATASITPNATQAGTYENFDYRLFDVGPGNPNGLGKVDQIRIANPFTNIPTVTEIKINNYSAYIRNAQDKPTQVGYATWYYDDAADSLVIQTSYFDVIDSMVVSFNQTMPQQTSTGNTFGSNYDAILDSTAEHSAQDGGYTVDVTAGDVAYYQFNPAGDQTIRAGDTLDYQITAYDQYDNAVVNSDTVIISSEGSGTAQIIPNDTLVFNNSSTLSFSVSDTVDNDFTVRVQKKNASSVRDESGTIQIQGASADHFVIISSQDSIRVGNERLLRVGLEDEYGNRLSDSTVTFTRVQGNGYFSDNDQANITAVTDGGGVAEALYTASDSTGFGEDRIEVSFNTVTDSITLPLKAGAVSYYAFSPPGDQTIRAGDTLDYQITAYDQYDNAVVNSDTVIISSEGSGTAQIIPNDTLVFNNSSTLSFSVSDTVDNDFTVRVQKKNASSVRDESGTIQIQGASADHFVIISSQDSIRVGNERLLRVGLEDEYGNRLSDSTVTFTRVQGNGYFSDNDQANITAVTDGGGVAEALYTASDSTGFGEDRIEVSFNTVTDSITLPLKAGPVSYYTFSPQGEQNMVAGDSLTYTLTGRDQYGNPVKNNDTVNLSASGSSTAVFIPASPTFNNSNSLNFQVTDTQTGSFNIVAEKTTDASVNGRSDLITVNPAALDYVLVRSESNNGGFEFGDSTITTDDVTYFYSAGYDRYGNFIADEPVDWSSTGRLEAVSATGSKFGFNPSVSEVNGRIVADHSNASVSDDSTGLITVNDGALAELRMQLSPQAGGVVLNDTTINADQFLEVFSVGYDADGNYIGRITSNWDSSGVVDNVTPTNPTDSVHFEAVEKGTGNLKAEADADPAVSTRSGLITVEAGAITEIIIRDEPNGNGQEIGNRSITAGQTLNLYAAGYDNDRNFNSNTNVDWHTSSGLAGLGDSVNTYVTTLSPSQVGSGFVYTENSSGWQDDSTGTITVQEGSLASIRIQTEPGADGTELTSRQGKAGSSDTLYAAGYDSEGNYLGLQAVRWSWEGDSIGYFKNSTSDTSENEFFYRIVNKAQFKITKNNLTDYSGIIETTPGDAASLASSPTDTVSAVVGGQVSDSLLVRVSDAYGNRVPDIQVQWLTPSAEGSLAPATDLTDENGVSRSKWTVKNTIGLDSAYAVVNAIPDTAWYFANVLNEAADSMAYVSGDGQTDTVNTDLNQPFVVQVLDSLGNPVQGISITFSVDSADAYPEGGGDFTIYTVSDLTDSEGKAQTRFKLGSKVGTYKVCAHNSQLLNSPVIFTAEAVPDAPDTIIVHSGNEQQGTVGQQLGQPLTVKIVDAYDNPRENIGVQWAATADGSVTAANDSSYTNAEGLASTNWILRTQAGDDTLYARSSGLSQAVFTADADADAAENVIAYSGNNETNVAGGNQTIKAQATDQYNNVVSETNVRFLPVSRVSDQSSETNRSGIAKTVYTLPKNQDSSLAKAYIEGKTDTAYFNIYGLRYGKNSLQPKAVNPGDTTTFYVDITNPGTEEVQLEANNTTFSFSDENILISTTLDSPSVLTAGESTATLKFAPVVIDSALEGGNYTPDIQLQGSADDSSLAGVLSTSPAELSVEPLQIVLIDVQDPADKNVKRGGALDRIMMRVRNSGNYTIDVEAAELTFNPNEGFTQSAEGGNPGQIGADGIADFYFSVDVPQSANSGDIVVDGYISGVLLTSGDPVRDADADQTDTFTIMPNAELSYVNFSPQTVSRNQLTIFETEISNSGRFDVIAQSDSTRLVFGDSVFYLNAKQTIAADGNSILTFSRDNVDLPANARYAGTLYIKGTENNQPFRDTLYTADGGDSLWVQQTANLNLLSLILSDTTVRRGESDDTLSVVLRNEGQAVAVISDDDSVQIFYDARYVITSMQGFPYSIPGGATDTLRYGVETSENAPLGADTFRVEVGYYDENSEVDYQERDNSVYDRWEIIGAGRINITSVQSQYDSVSTGQDSILVVTRLINSGENTVRVDSVKLNISKGQYDPATLHKSSVKTLQPAESDTFRFFVSVDESSNSGTASLNARAYGVDTYDSRFIEDQQSDTTDSWIVQKAVDIVTIDNQPGVVSSGQPSTPTATIDNNGEARLIIDKENSRIQALGNPSFSRKLVSPDVIEGRSNNVLLTFEADDIEYNSGRYTLELHLEGTENKQPYTQDISVPNDLIIQSPANIVIDSVSADANNISRGADTVATVVVSNTGEATLILDSLMLKPYPDYTSIQPSLPMYLSGDDEQSFQINFTVPGDAQLGTVTLDARAVGRDSNYVEAEFDSTLEDDGATVSDQWDVHTAADLEVTAMTSTEDVVNLGQNNIPVEITFQNNGSAPAQVTSLMLEEAIGLYKHRYPPIPFTVNGNSDTTVVDTLDVLDNSATGDDTLYTVFDYRDRFSNKTKSKQSNTFLDWTIIKGESPVEIISVQTEPERVSQGQRAIEMQIRLKNKGDVSATVNDIELLFTGGVQNYTRTAASPALPYDLAPGLEQIFSIDVDVQPDAQTGPDTLFASIDVTESAGGTNYSVTDSTINDRWTVQQRPDISIDSVRVSPDLASTGQQGLRATVYVRNTAASYRADARIDSVQLLMRKGGAEENDQFNINRESTPSLPLTLGPASSNRFEFELDVQPSTDSGDYEVDASVAAVDVNDGEDRSVTGSSAPDQLAVQTVANLVVNQPWIVPDTVSVGQTHGRVYVEFENRGQASAAINSTQLIFDQPSLNFNEMLINRTTPFTIAGQSKDTLIYGMEIPETFTDTLTVGVDAKISSEDTNSGQTVDAQSDQPGYFLIEEPADAQWVETTPSSWPVDTTSFQFRVKIKNDGEATIRLDTSLTSLQIKPLDSNTSLYSIPLADTSNLIVASQPDTTELVFRESTLPIPEGEYRLQVDLQGTTNDSVYEEMLDAGNLVFGEGIISITSIKLEGPDPYEAVQGQDSVVVLMKVSNTQQPREIDSTLTKLIYYGPGKSGSRDVYVENLTRLDTLTILKKEDNNQLKFRFDLSENFPLDNPTEIYGQIGLDNGTFVEESNVFDEMFVRTIGEAKIVNNSFAPDSVIRSETVRFTTDFYNTGSSDITLLSSESYVSIDGLTIDNIYLNSPYGIEGMDTTRVSFETVQLPDTLQNGNYNVTFHMVGRQISGSLVTNDTTLNNALSVIAPAELIFSAIDIPATIVRQAQQDVTVQYSLQNIGQSAAMISDIDYRFFKEETDVSNGWFLQRSPSITDTIKGGETLQFTKQFEISNNAVTGFHRPRPEVTYSDIRRPSNSLQTDSVVVGDSVRVIQPAFLRIDSLVAIRDVLAPNAPKVNLGNNFRLGLFLQNTGEDTIQSARVRLYRNNNALEPLFQITNIPPDTGKVFYIVQNVNTMGTARFKAVIESAEDKTGKSVDLGQPVDNVEDVIVQQATSLSLDVNITQPEGARDGVVSIGQTFRVEAKILRSGNSPFTPGTLILRLPDNYGFEGETADSVRTFTADTSAVHWQVSPSDLTDGAGFDSLRVVFKEIPTDSNSLDAVAISKESTPVEARVEPSGAISSTLKIEEPAGALNDTLSTRQPFSIRTVVEFNPSVAEGNRRATVVLPPGFAVQDSSYRNLKSGVAADTIYWRLVAPDEAGDDADSIYVGITAQDANSGKPLSAQSEPYRVHVVKAADLIMIASVKEPEGTKDRTVSTHQEVVLETRVVNAGEAHYDNQGRIRLIASDGVRFKRTDAAQAVIEGFSNVPHLDTLLMPATATNANFAATFEQLPSDENSGLPVNVRRDSVNIALQIVERADLFVKFLRTTAIEDTLVRATEQTFNVAAYVKNRGVATVDTSRWLALDLNDSALQLNDDVARKAFDVGDTVSWSVKAPQNQIRERIYVRFDSNPIDVNEGLSAIRNVASEADTIYLNYKQIDNIELQTAYAGVSGDSLIVSSEQDSIQLRSDVFYDPQIDSARSVTLTLPEGGGYASLDTTLTKTLKQQSNTNINWLIRAPGSPGDWLPVVIRASGESKSIPGLTRQIVRDTLYIKTVERARLSLNVAIVEPAGATDDSLSYGQAFKLRGIVSNADEPDIAEAVGQGLAEINTDAVFELIDTLGFSADNQRTFTTGEPFYWWVRVRNQSNFSTLNKPTRPSELLQRSNNRTKSKRPTHNTDVNKIIREKIKSLNTTQRKDNGDGVTVELLSWPNDENTGKQAFLQNRSFRKQVYLQEKAGITMQTLQLPDTLSTAQNITMQIRSQIKGNLINPTAIVQWPEGINPEPQEFALDQNGRASIQFEVPDDYSGLAEDTLFIYLSGVDANTGFSIDNGDLVQRVLAIEKRPVLALGVRLTAPPSLVESGIAYQGQEVLINVKPVYSGDSSPIPYASLAGEGSITIDEKLFDRGFTLPAGETRTKAFNTVDQELQWRIKAPQKELTAGIKIQFEQLPHDRNSGLNVLVDKDSGSVSLPVRIREKAITVKLLRNLLQEQPEATNREIMAFSVSNQPFDDSLNVAGLQLALYSSVGEIGEQTLLNSAAINNMLQSISVSRWHGGRALAKESEHAQGEPFINYDVTDSTLNPLQLNFSEEGIIAPGENDTLMVTAALKDKAVSRGFRSVLRNVYAYDFDAQNPLTIIDTSGTEIEESVNFQGDAQTIFSDNPEKDFGNFPNPFGRTHPVTNIRFSLKQPSDVQIRIFTLVGELVWTWQRENLGTGVYESLARWDGRNDKGEQVLNGVYICTIDIKPGDGSSSQRYITKIAFIK